jgi:hypothetical protein
MLLCIGTTVYIYSTNQNNFVHLLQTQSGMDHKYTQLESWCSSLADGKVIQTQLYSSLLRFRREFPRSQAHTDIEGGHIVCMSKRSDP